MRPAVSSDHEQFDREHADIVKRVRDLLGDGTRICGQRIRDRGGHAREFQDVIAVLVFGDVVTFDFTVDRARGDHGDLALERNEGFEDRGFGAEIFPDLSGIVAFADDRLALAVIAEAAGLDHGGKADARDRRVQGFNRRHVGIVGGVDAEPLDEVLFDQPVLRGLQDLLRGQYGTARGQHHGGGGRHVLEFIGDDVDIVGEQLERLDVGIFGAGRVQHHVEGG